MRALVTNDDGVDSPGIRSLARACETLGLDVTVAAPAWDSSGASASLTGVQQDGRLLFDRRESWGRADVFGVEAAPAFIVRAAIHGAFGQPPDVVVSGINVGPNTGHAVLHSGTVGAALTGSTFGRPAAAFSTAGVDAPHWETAEEIAMTVVRWLVAAAGPITLNVNVPDLPLDRVKGLVPAHLARFGAVQTNVTEVGEGYVRFEYGPLAVDYEPGTDAAVLADGYASVTALSIVCEQADADLSGLGLSCGGRG